MGMRAEGRVFWGIAYDNDELPEDYDMWEKVDDFVMSRRKIDVPEPPLDKLGGYAGPEWDEWRKKNQEWEAKQAQCRHRGYCDYSSPYLFVKESEISAEWDETTEVHSLDVKPDWEGKLKELVEYLGLPWKQPRWLLTSYYG